MLPSLPLSANIDPLTLSLALNGDYLVNKAATIFTHSNFCLIISNNLNISSTKSTNQQLQLSIYQFLRVSHLLTD